MMKPVLLIMMVVALAPAALAADGPCIVPGRGHFQIHTGTSGLFGAFAHDHLIEAQKIEGCATLNSTDLARSSIKLTFTTADIRVIDTKENAEDRAKVQKTMETEVLSVKEFPRVVFESTSIERAGAADALRVHGNLTIRGKTQPVVIPLNWSRQPDGTYRATGTYKFKQTSFGIRPVQLGGGTIKVKDELSAEFELFLK